MHIKISEFLSVQSLHLYLKCKSFLKPYFKNALKFLIKLLKISKQTCKELFPNFLNKMLIIVQRKMNTKVYFLLYVISIRLFWEEKNSEPKVGLEFIISMMVILQYALTFYITILKNMNKFHTKIWNIYTERLCMEDILRMIGIEEQIILIWKYWSSLIYCPIWI